MVRALLCLVAGAGAALAVDEDTSLMQMLVTSEGELKVSEERSGASCKTWLVEEGVGYVEQQANEAAKQDGQDVLEFEIELDNEFAGIASQVAEMSGKKVTLPKPAHVASVCAAVADHLESTEWTGTPCKNTAGVTKECQKAFTPTCNFVAKSLKTYAKSVQKQQGAEFKSTVKEWDADKAQKKDLSKKYKAADKDFKMEAKKVETVVQNNCKALSKSFKTKGKSAENGNGKKPGSDLSSAANAMLADWHSGLTEIQASLQALKAIIQEMSPDLGDGPGDDGAPPPPAGPIKPDDENHLLTGSSMPAVPPPPPADGGIDVAIETFDS